MSAGDVTSSGAGADSPEEVVAGSIQLQRRGDLHGAFEKFWYPGYLHTIEFLNEELQITDLVIGQPVPHSPLGPPYDWQQAVSGRSPRQVAERSPVLRLLLVPHGVELAGLIRGEVVSRGITQIVWSFGPRTVMPPPETARRRLSGDCTLVDVRGHLVLVSYASPAGTTLSWRSERAGTGCSVTMQTPVDPVLAVQRLARDTLLLPAAAQA